MPSHDWKIGALVFAALASVPGSAPAQIGTTVPNWTVPAASATPSGRMTTQGDVTYASPFVGVKPCRIVDTRGPAGPYGAPALSAGTPRNFNLLTGPCTGFPPMGVSAVSLNITVTNTLGPGFILIYPMGGTKPVVSTLNYVAGQTVANAAIVPLSDFFDVTVSAGVSGADLIIDINGYFAFDLNDGNTSILEGVSSSALVYVINSSTGQGVIGQAFGTGVEGLSGPGIGVKGASTLSDGVVGSTNSSAADMAGVLGIDGTGTPNQNSGHASAGVRGASTQHIGVFGLSEANAVAGYLFSGGVTVARGFLGTTMGTGAGGATGPWGVFAQGDFGASGAKHFVEPHPSDPHRVIVYTSIEGRTADTYFRGTGRFVDHAAVIEVPEDFRIVTDESGLTVQITPIGGPASTWVETRDLYRVVVRSSSDVEFDYLIQGVRRAFKDVRPVQVGYEFVPESADETIPAYLPEESRRRLIANGTYNPDGTVNRATAERLGWTRIWAQRETGGKSAKAPSVGRDPGAPAE
ncbi:MAG TPA: hypothetical protein VKE50_00175 [Thermoanaerobaculia bacterium]|nr:hypothetical protein [Thermoanaerobaculia bacterium]